MGSCTDCPKPMHFWKDGYTMQGHPRSQPGAPGFWFCAARMRTVLFRNCLPQSVRDALYWCVCYVGSIDASAGKKELGMPKNGWIDPGCPRFESSCLPRIDNDNVVQSKKDHNFNHVDIAGQTILPLNLIFLPLPDLFCMGILDHLDTLFHCKFTEIFCEIFVKKLSNR